MGNEEHIMKCQNCGADLADGVLFCRECGAKVEMQKKYCRECGKEVPVDARFCSYCGADLSVIPVLDQPVSDEEAETPTSGNEETPVHTQLSHPSNDAEYSTAVTIWDKIAMKLQAFWSGLNNFSKVFTIASVIVVLLLLISFASHNAVAAFFSVLQIAGLVISMLWHKGVLNPPREWLKYITLAIAILFTVLNIMSYSWDKNKVVEESDKSTVSSSETNATNTIVSPPYNAADCLGQNYDTVKNDFISAGFIEIYTDAVEDLSYSESERIDTIESISIGGNDSFADGEQFSKSDKVEISYHAYKKVTVSIDVDFLSNIFFDKYGVVVYLNEEKVGELAHGEDKSFSLQVSPGTYTLTFQKKDDTSCVGSIELDVKGDVNASVQISCQSDNICVTPLYIEKIGEVREGEIMMPQALSSFKYKNYLDVQNTLENLGFTNISTEILYDIHWGWTAEGEVESVSIDGNADSVRGDIFSADSPIIITYHMKEEDDPNRPTEASTSAAETTLPATQAEEDTSVYYSTNTKDTYKNGNTGIYAYKSIGNSYDNYWIIDFDDGYVYSFSEGLGDNSCSKFAIESGDLNSTLAFSMHSDGTTYQWFAFFKWKNQPDHLVIVDDGNFDYDFYPTNLSDALRLKKQKNIGVQGVQTR
jgi:hypothetical protein